jgi:hypothetical protein
MPDSSPSPAAPASCGSRDAVSAHATSGVNGPQRRQLRLRAAEANRNFAAPLQHQTRQRRPKIQEIPAPADVAQLVEHFTRNEGVPGSSPGVGFVETPAMTGVSRLGVVRPAGRAVGMEAFWKPPEMRSAPAPDSSEGACLKALRRLRVVAARDAQDATPLSSVSGACADAVRPSVIAAGDEQKIWLRPEFERWRRSTEGAPLVVVV